MSSRSGSSTTSLADHAGTTPPDPIIRNLDFCNAFWGVGDVGVDVLFARMCGATQTMEELRIFWKERYVLHCPLPFQHTIFLTVVFIRSTIEEEYGKRLAQLSKMPIGKDEIGCVSS